MSVESPYDVETTQPFRVRMQAAHATLTHEREAVRLLLLELEERARCLSGILASIGEYLELAPCAPPPHSDLGPDPTPAAAWIPTNSPAAPAPVPVPLAAWEVPACPRRPTAESRILAVFAEARGPLPVEAICLGVAARGGTYSQGTVTGRLCELVQRGTLLALGRGVYALAPPAEGV